MTTTRNLPPLGTTALAVLLTLDERGHWFAGCGWHWDCRSTTERYMTMFEKRGYATRSQAPYPPAISASQTYRRWDITDAGHAAAEAAR